MCLAGPVGAPMLSRATSGLPTRGPHHEDVEFLGRQRMGLPERAEPVIGIPGRHVRGHQLGANRFGPGKGVLVRQQRHRRDAAIDVASAAALADDREDVIGVVVLRGNRLVGLARLRADQDAPEDGARQDDPPVQGRTGTSPVPTSSGEYSFERGHRGRKRADTRS